MTQHNKNRHHKGGARASTQGLHPENTRNTLPFRPSRGLGQNFLMDPKVLNYILAFCGDFEGISVVEIGGGLGTLTQALLQTPLKQLITLEKDTRCLPFLSKLSQQDKRLSILHGDVMDMFPWTIGSEPRRAIGNLPYAISVPLILRCAENAHKFEKLIFTVQREVAQRLIARPGSPFYGRLAVMVQARMSVTECWLMPPELFTPPPKVHSSVIRLEPKSSPLNVSWNHLSHITRLLFASPRKKIRHALINYFPEKSWQEANLPFECRPGELTLEQVKKIADLYNHCLDSK